jgi:hypothetical protein
VVGGIVPVGRGVRVDVGTVAVGCGFEVFVGNGDAVGTGVQVDVGSDVAVGAGVQVKVGLGDAVGTGVRVGVFDGITVGIDVKVGVIVGGWPDRTKVPDAFQPVPMNTCTS